MDLIPLYVTIQNAERRTANILVQIINGFQATEGFLRVFGAETPTGTFIIKVSPMVWSRAISRAQHVVDIVPTHHKFIASWTYRLFHTHRTILDVFWTACRFLGCVVNVIHWHYDPSCRDCPMAPLSRTINSRYTCNYNDSVNIANHLTDRYRQWYIRQHDDHIHQRGSPHPIRLYLGQIASSYH